MNRWYFLMMIFLMPLKLFAQNDSIPALEHDITLNLNNQPLSTILDDISRQANFIFSYNPEAINSNDLYSINIRQKTVRHALNTIFNGSVEYKVRGKYVILKKNSFNSGTADYSKKERVIEGYIVDSRSGNKVTNVSVYDKNLLVSVITDRYGYFRLDLPSGKTVSVLHISKQGYTDTLIIPTSGKTSFVNVELSLLNDNQNELAANNTLKPLNIGPNNSSRLPHWLIPDKLRINSRNIKDTIFRKVQFSLLPLLSTNKLLTGSVVNKVSINLTVGYVQGVSVTEVGGVFNLVRDDAKVCQLAGVGNIVGGSFQGLQAAGILNITKNMKGVQAGGVLNLVRDDAKSCQLAGVGNIVGNSYRGLQVAGVINNAANMNGVQIAGVMNISRKVSGIQIAGIINKANYIKGVQFSVFNFADSCDGVPLGLFSLVKTGYHKIEISADELFYSNVSIRTGVKQFHTILMAGIRPDNFNNLLWSFGYGIGTSIGKPPKLLYDIDITGQQIIKGSFSDSKNTLYKIYIGADRKVATKTSIAIGITYNFYVSDTNSSTYQEKYSSIAPYYFSNTSYHTGLNLKTWLGGKIAIRFL